MLLIFIKAVSEGTNIGHEREWALEAGEDEPRPYNLRVGLV
jgi:hypothetical protein